MNLQELAIKYGSDKADHGYCPFYEKHLPHNPRKILEIGVLKGASLAMWAEYFPDSEIHGLDLFAENREEDIEAYLRGELGFNNIILHKGNQCNWLLLEVLRNEDFDVIIDDGSHNSRDQMITFFGLYNGKQYYIEDIHCCDEEFYQQGLPSLFTAKSIFGEMAGNDLDCFHTGRNVNLSREQKIICINTLNCQL